VFSVIPYRPLKIFGSKNWGDICIKLNKKSMGFIKIDKTGARAPEFFAKLQNDKHSSTCDICYILIFPAISKKL